ncbi:hypothetical protein [Sphingomicrobium lutaoense]|uniref:Uracil-DNA glycosylase-like domain-containing protein n=1 Tax=Sphingomicrobium lutaoense TaxID=515949 RepID=A0A839Z074_9SPHN|nr:hypothetical protein [Sphingomicrobium lutaoense]MBB3763447.1 hypothetical protein [Sphingomicrobium lutaoense]
MTLPDHGKVNCSRCFSTEKPVFDQSQSGCDKWRLTNNPLSWGAAEPEVIVLGFSKGPMQAGYLATTPHNEIAFRGGRTQLAKILHHVGLISEACPQEVSRLIEDPHGRFHFASLVRCTVEQFEAKTGSWIGTGGGMLDKFATSETGKKAIGNCVSEHLACLPAVTRLVVMLGMGSLGNYIRACRTAFARHRPGTWRDINEVSYTDGDIVVVHVEHFKSQGALLPNWLSGELHPRGRLGLAARDAVRMSRIGWLHNA